MKTYHLVEKVAKDYTGDEMTGAFALISYALLAQEGKKECKLIIDENYYIERYTNKKRLYYVHVKDGHLMKVCVYERV